MGIIQRLLCITFMSSQSHLWRYCCIVMSRGPWLLRRCFKRGFGNHRKQPIYEFNWIVISIEIQLIKLQIEWLKYSHSLFVNSFFQQQSLFRSNLARLNNGGPSVVVVARFQFCLIKNGGQKTKSLHYEMNSLDVISKQPTLRACVLLLLLLLLSLLLLLISLNGQCH